MLQKTILVVVSVALIICGYNLYREKEANRDLGSRIEYLELQLKAEIQRRIAESRQSQEKLYAQFSKDKNGRLPVDVINEYLQANRQKNYKAMYELMVEVPDDVSLEVFVKGAEKDSSFIEYYNIEDFILLSKDRAVVFITYKMRMGDKTFYQYWEPWACVRENDIWKVRWLPRQ